MFETSLFFCCVGRFPAWTRGRPGGRRRGSDPLVSRTESLAEDPPARLPQQISPLHKSVFGIFNSRHLLSPHLSHTHSAPRSIAAFFGARRIKQSLFVFSLSIYIVILISGFIGYCSFSQSNVFPVRSLAILRAWTICFRCFWDAFFCNSGWIVWILRFLS